MRHVRPKFGSNTPRTLTLPFTTQQAPMKLKLSEGAYNRIRWAMGQLFAPRAFGSKKCVVLAFVVRPFIHSRFEFTSAEASGNLGFPRGPRAFGSKKCVVLAFVVRPFIHSRFEFTSAEASGNLGFPRGIYFRYWNALSLRARAGPLGNFRALLPLHFLKKKKKTAVIRNSY